MLSWIQKNKSVIGIDMGNDIIKIAQLERDGKQVKLVAGGSQVRPGDITPGTVQWQKWAIEAIKKIMRQRPFKGKNAVVALPANEVYLDFIKKPKNQSNIEALVEKKLKSKLPFASEDAIIKFLDTDTDSLLVIATEKEKINRHLAIYEKANLKVNGIDIWPSAMTYSYASFFGRRKTDLDSVVILLDIENSYSNIVICRHKNLISAKCIPIGADQLETDGSANRLIMELNTCKQQFENTCLRSNIERMIFLSGQLIPREICVDIAKQMELPAQIGDCVSAVEVEDAYEVGIDRRECQFSWATAFGLSLSNL